jgi:hypothetical protein
MDFPNLNEQLFYKKQHKKVYRLIFPLPDCNMETALMYLIFHITAILLVHII